MDRLGLRRGRRWTLRVLWTLASIICGLNPQTAIAAVPEALNLFGEVAGGYTHIVPDDKGETSKNGYHLLLTGFGEMASTDWIYQLGGGFFYDRIYSNGEKQYPGTQADTVKKQKNLRIETRAGEAEIGARYRLRPNLEIGLLLRSLFGSSLSFSQDKDTKSAKFFIGPHAVLRLGEETEWLKRIDVSLLADLNVPDRRVYLLTAGFAIGKTFRKPLDPTPPAPPPPAPVEDRFEEILADKIINFPSGSSVVQGAALPFLKDLGDFLKANPGLWNQVDVEGHTDKNGKLAFNMKLSKDRAEAVRQVLIGQGADGAKIKAQGFGPTRPLVEETNAETRATNRRVVMAFNVSGREQRNKLSTYIKELRKKYFNEP